MNNFEELKTGIKSKVLQALDFSKDISDEEMLELIDRELFGSTRGLAISMESRCLRGMPVQVRTDPTRLPSDEQDISR